MRPFPLTALVVAPGLALAAAIAIRMLVIEPSHVGQACDVAPWEGWCAARTAMVLSFRYQEFGWFALAVGVLATLLRRRWLGSAALCLGLAGLVLYSYEPAGVAALLGLLVVVRGQDVRGQDVRGQAVRGQDLRGQTPARSSIRRSAGE